ncbi:hypothetical protein M422DRAFT_64439 [Sphaerobolus stellatus SS14]|nr:hypothetical protein M422DRAFT_64439 [Sphaerobolus stellatus SS14]
MTMPLPAILGPLFFVLAVVVASVLWGLFVAYRTGRIGSRVHPQPDLEAPVTVQRLPVTVISTPEDAFAPPRSESPSHIPRALLARSNSETRTRILRRHACMLPPESAHRGASLSEAAPREEEPAHNGQRVPTDHEDQPQSLNVEAKASDASAHLPPFCFPSSHRRITLKRTSNPNPTPDPELKSQPPSMTLSTTNENMVNADMNAAPRDPKGPPPILPANEDIINTDISANLTSPIPSRAATDTNSTPDLSKCSSIQKPKSPPPTMPLPPITEHIASNNLSSSASALALSPRINRISIITSTPLTAAKRKSPSALGPNDENLDPNTLANLTSAAATALRTRNRASSLSASPRTLIITSTPLKTNANSTSNPTPTLAPTTLTSASSRALSNIDFNFFPITPRSAHPFSQSYALRHGSGVNESFTTPG